MTTQRVRQQRLSRRTALVGAALLLSAGALSGCTETGGAATPTGPIAEEDMIMVSAVRSLTNPYEVAWIEGSRAFADSVGVELRTIVYNGDSQQALSQLQAVLAGDKRVLLNVNPNTTADTPAIVNAVRQAGGYAVTQWSKPDDLNPWDIGDNWVAYVTYDGITQGYDTGQALIDSVGGEGGVIALQGLLSNEISQSRYAGFERALEEQSGVELLDTQPADFDRNKAYSVTKTLLTRFGDEISGVWAATDEMALGAMQAIRERGLLGEVQVASAADATPEGLEAIQAGDMVATYTTGPYFNGAMGLALAYQAATQQIDVGALPESQRCFYVEQYLITADNVADFIEVPTDEEIVASVEDPFVRNVGPIE